MVIMLFTLYNQGRHRSMIQKSSRHRNPEDSAIEVSQTSLDEKRLIALLRCLSNLIVDGAVRAELEVSR